MCVCILQIKKQIWYLLKININYIYYTFIFRNIYTRCLLTRAKPVETKWTFFYCIIKTLYLIVWISFKIESCCDKQVLGWDIFRNKNYLETVMRYVLTCCTYRIHDGLKRMNIMWIERKGDSKRKWDSRSGCDLFSYLFPNFRLVLILLQVNKSERVKGRKRGRSIWKFAAICQSFNEVSISWR